MPLTYTINLKLRFLILFMKKKGANAPDGIKNSWKYEKDLIIFNGISVIFTIAR